MRMSVFSMSEEDKKYYQNNASMKDQMQIVGEAFQEMPSVGEAFASAGRGAVDWASGIGPGVRDYVKKVRHLYDDNVVVPAGSKTLLGEDVSTLFEGAREIDCESMSGTGMKEIVGTCWYGTEMMSGNLKSGSPRSLCCPRSTPTGMRRERTTPTRRRPGSIPTLWPGTRPHARPATSIGTR